MANQVEKLNTVAPTDIEKVNTLTDAQIEKINTLEFAGTAYTVAVGARLQQMATIRCMSSIAVARSKLLL